jgi:hypothetical protein
MVKKKEEKKDEEANDFGDGVVVFVGSRDGNGR